MNKVVLIVMSVVTFSLMTVSLRLAREHVHHPASRLLTTCLILSTYAWMTFLPLWAVFFTGPLGLFLSFVRPWQLKWMLPAACAAVFLTACFIPSESEIVENVAAERLRLTQEIAEDIMSQFPGGGARPGAPAPAGR